VPDLREPARAQPSHLPQALARAGLARTGAGSTFTSAESNRPMRLPSANARGRHRPEGLIPAPPGMALRGDEVGAVVVRSPTSRRRLPDGAAGRMLRVPDVADPSGADGGMPYSPYERSSAL
jgi:hypothetical protein